MNVCSADKQTPFMKLGLQEVAVMGSWCQTTPHAANNHQLDRRHSLRDCVQAPTPVGRAADRGASQRPSSSLLAECLAAKSRWSTAAM